MATKYVRGDKAVGICQRSGIKMLRRDMVEDGYYPGLMVHPQWKDERHPQERLPKLADPVTVYKPAPDDVGDPPELSGELTGNSAHLTWTEAAPINARIDSYDLYRRPVGGEFTLVVSLPVTYDIFMAITSETLVYDDVGLSTGVTFEYFVVANTDPEGPDVLSSNIIELAVAGVHPLAGSLALAGNAPTSGAVVTFQFALASASVNGTTFTAPAPWAFGAGNFTCGFWFRDTGISVDNAQFRVLRARPISGGQSGWEAQVRNGNVGEKIMRLLLRPAGVSFTFDSPTLFQTDGTWTHYAFVIDRGANTVTFYRNAVSEGSLSIAAVSGSVGFATSMLILQAIAGEVDELRVWSVARTGAEILADYLTPFTSFSDPNLIADWQFNEGTGSTTTESKNGTVASIVSGGSFVAGPP